MSESVGGAAPAASGGESAPAVTSDASTNTGTTQAQNQGPGGQAPVANQPTKAELRELAEGDLDALVTIKVNGQTRKVSVKEALKQAELGVGAQQRMEAAAKERKEAQRLAHLAKTDPDKYLQEMGHDPDQYAERRLVSKYEKMAMTPEQREHLETKERLNNYEKQEQQSKQTMLGELKQYLNDIPEGMEKASKEEIFGQLQRAKQVYSDQLKHIEKDFIEAWQATGLPKLPIFGQWTASLMHASQVQKNSGQREQALQAGEAAAIVKENFIKSVTEITGQMNAEAVSQLLGPETMKKLREFDVQRVTGAKPAPSLEQSNRPGQRPASGSKNSKTVNESGWKQAFANIK
jgi:hypothetical protein